MIQSLYVLGQYHVSQMAKQMHLRASEFVDAVNCSLSHEDYDQILRARVLDEESP
jgi:hypothetical protein